MKPKKILDGNAIVYCEGAFNTTNGKTAHGLVRFTERYRILSVIDSRYAGQDAGKVIDGKSNGIPVSASVEKAIKAAEEKGTPAQYLVIGLAPDGGRLPDSARQHIRNAISKGLNVDSGLHDFLTDDPEIGGYAVFKKVRIRDIRKTPSRNSLHFFSGKIKDVKSLKIALLGTDSAVGKRTTAWRLVHALRDAGHKAEMIGTGQTSWMQGARYSIIMDSLINDFVAGELENATYNAWTERKPDVIVVEGQGSLLHPAYPGGFEILAATKPDIVILQHAPKRKCYDEFPDEPLHPLSKQIQAIEIVSGKPVVAITLNHEKMTKLEVGEYCNRIQKETGLPTFDVLIQGTDGLLQVIDSHLEKEKITDESTQISG